METALRVAALCVTASLLGALLRRSEGELALLLTLAAVLCALCALLPAAYELVALARELTALSGLSPTVFVPLGKVLAIALVVRLGGAYCRDASQEALGAALELAGTVCALLSCAPLLRATVELVEGWL